MNLAHLRIPGLINYGRAASVQDNLVQRLLTHKASPSAKASPASTILTAEFTPVYTCGRREINAVSPRQASHLRANGAADFLPALRGGQTTFHGPGQLVAYPILDLKRHRLTARSYVHLLEEAVIKTVGRYGVAGFRTENPGVWTSDTEKICALGVHLRRNVSSHGVGLNVGTEMGWFDRIVACGLEGKRATSLEKCGAKVSVNEVAYAFVEEMKILLGIEEIVTTCEEDVMSDKTVRLTA